MPFNYLLNAAVKKLPHFSYIKFPNNENPFPEKRELSLLNPAII